MDRVSDRWRMLVEGIRDRFGFEIRHDIIDKTARNSKQERIELMIVIAKPNHLASFYPALKEIETKLIIYSADQCKHEVKEYTEVIKRCAVHLSAGASVFKELCPELIDKHVIFPHFFASQERYVNLEFNEKPVMKCLYTGSRAKSYKIRRHIYLFAKGKDGSKTFDILDRPKGMCAQSKGAVVGDNYAQRLNRYFCCVTGTLHGYPLAKHFEIMASGSLLLSDETEDLKTLGMIPDKHYVVITKENFEEKIRHCLAHPDDYRQIRLNGMKYSRVNHGIESRLNQLEKILEGT